MSEAVGYMADQLTISKYYGKIRWILYSDSKLGRTFIFFTRALKSSQLKVTDRTVLQMAETAPEC